MSHVDDVNRKVLELVKAGHLDKEMAVGILKKLNPPNEDVAIIGVACKFPGANNLEQFWHNMKHGMVDVGDFPQSRRQDADKLLPPHLKDPYFQGGFLEHVDQFDAEFFQISAEEASAMDPYQRLFLETAFEAVEEAGYSGKKIYGSHTGVFVGTDHTTRLMGSYFHALPRRDFHALMGNWTSILASRTSHVFNLTGPSMVIDSGCSSGMIAIHQACRALKNKDCDMALVGGINLFMTPISPGAMFDQHGQVTRVFDRNPGGTGWGEAVASVVLKPLRAAVRDRDHIHAVIKGSAINNNGSSSKLAEMSAEALKKVVLSAWADAKVNPESISYVEVHGVATMMGDSMEVSGLNAAFKSHTDKKQFCALGSAKANVSHTVAGSGMASLFKMIGALKHNQLPPSVHFQEPNSVVPFCNSALYVNDTLQNVEAGDTPMRVGINSYGFSGTNCHLVLEEAPAMAKTQDSTPADVHVLTLSAKSEPALRRLVEKYVVFLRGVRQEDLADVCYTANAGRGHYTHRLAIVCSSAEEARGKLESALQNGFATLQAGYLYQVHSVISSRDVKTAGALLEGEKKQLSMKTNRMLTSHAGTALDRDELLELAGLYVQGADLDFELLYKGQQRFTCSLPTYSLERTRHWLPQVTDIPDKEGATHS